MESFISYVYQLLCRRLYGCSWSQQLTPYDEHSSLPTSSAFGALFVWSRCRPMPKDAAAPFLRWAGSKRKLLPHLAPYWGSSYTRYVEPFMGSASLFYAANPSAAILSDINHELVNAFVSVRDHPRAVHNRLIIIPKGKRSYKKLRKLDLASLDPLDRAARFIFLNRYCFNGIYRTNNNGTFNVPYAQAGTGNLPTWDVFWAAARPLTDETVKVCAYDSSESAFLQAKQATIELTLRTI
jgi:DNA adenine methylase Dam